MYQTADVYKETDTSEETKQFAESVAKTYLTQPDSRENATVLCLYGELGSGKTTFIQGFVVPFGIRERILSPTYIIGKRYSVSGRYSYLYHFDLYRTGTEEDFINLGMQEVLDDPQHIVLIEWAEKLGAKTPAKRTNILCSVIDGERHTFRISDYV